MQQASTHATATAAAPPPHHVLEQRCGWCGTGYHGHDTAACGHAFWAVVGAGAAG